MVSLENLEPGDMLGKSLYNEYSDLLLAAGYKLDSKLIELLKRYNFNYVFVMDSSTEDIVPEDVISEALRYIGQATVSQTYKEIQKNPVLQTLSHETVKSRLEKDPKFKHLIKMRKIRLLVGDLVEEILYNNVKIFAALPIKSDNAKEYQHALDTCLVSILLGQVFDYNLKELKVLGTSALLHDVGKIIYVKRSSRLPDDEEQMKQMIIDEHPTYSMLILQSSDPSSYAEQLTVHQHHERLDGKGFPKGLTSVDMPPISRISKQGSQIYRHALILAVANRYDNLISGMVEEKQHTPDEALASMAEGAGTAWNPYVVKALHQVIQRYPVGSTVRIKRISSGDYIGFSGVVSKVNLNEPTKPELVLTHNALGKEIEPKRVNLILEKQLSIELVL